MSSFFVLRPALCAALLLAAAAGVRAGGAALAPPLPSAAGASAPAGATGGPYGTAAARSGAAPAGPAALEPPPVEIGIPDLRQRIGERLAAMRAARAAARRSESAAPAVAAAEPATPSSAASSTRPPSAVAAHRPASPSRRATPAATGEARPDGVAAPAAAAPAASVAALGADKLPILPSSGAPGALPATRRSGAAAAHRHAEPHWSYGGETAPEAWASMKPEYATCGSGRRQSPIDIRDGIAVDLEPLRFDYQAGAFSVLDNGHTVQVDVAAGNTLAVGGRRYELRQFHFHRPSEERLDGRGYEMAAHLVHADPEGRLAVVAVLIDSGKAHPLVQQVWNNLPLEQHQPQAAPGPIDPGALLPEDRRYATYMGSLTTPPCTEGVLWIVMKQPATLSPEQIAIFARLYPMNARPLQAASGRLIKQSN